jgi:hypothetical protein
MDKVKPVLDWIKGHLLISAMGLLIIAFLGCGWYYAGILNGELSSEVSDRAKEFSKLTSANEASVTLPLVDGSWTAKGALNEKLLESLTVLSDRMSEDVEGARKAALMHNGDPAAGTFPGPGYQERLSSQGPSYPGTGDNRALKGWKDSEKARRDTGTKRILVSEDMFPNPPRHERENLSNDVHRALIASYRDMLSAAGAGQPPTLSEVENELTRFRSNYIQKDLNKGTAADLDDGQLAQLTGKLGEERLKFYNEAAETIYFYADESAFSLPEDPFVTKQSHGLGDLYEWHWNWWIAEDVISSIVRANTNAQGDQVPVPFAPVKRLVSVAVLDAPVVSGKGSSGGSGSGGRNAGRSRGGRENAGGGATEGSGALPEPDVSMDVATQTDFNVSMTGRSSNALYDVRTIGVVLVVETSKLPVLVDALARENFMTITDLSLVPASAFAAAEYGYMFGAEPISRVTMQIETVWLRKWTAAWMPQEVRDALGVKSKGT